MLTSDLLRIRRASGKLQPRYLHDKVRRRLLPVAEDLVGKLTAALGDKREDVDQALGTVEHKPTDRIVIAGLRKLLTDRCDFAGADGRDPMDVRHVLFRIAAEQRRGLAAAEAFDRHSALERAASELDEPIDVIEQRLFADLRANERLLRIKTIRAEALIDRYNVALAQGVLLRATRVMVTIDSERPGTVRQLFRAARFHGLLHRVERRGEHRWQLAIDGPLSLFSAVNKYGLRLALFLPAVLHCEHWQLRADVLWGKRKEAMRFELGPDDGLVPSDNRVTGVAPGIDEFVARFQKLESAWSIAVNDEIIALPGETACVPDLLFTNQQTGEEVFLEAFGFWSRDAVWQRIETISRGFPSRIILAVGKHLRVSEELLAEDDAGQLYVYKRTMQPKAVLKRLDAAPS